MLELVKEEPDVDDGDYNDDDSDSDDGDYNGNNDVVFAVVLENVEPPQDGGLADPLGAHHHHDVDVVDDDDGDGDDGNYDGNNDDVVEPSQDGGLADPLRPHYHQFGSVLLQEHG